MGRKAKYSKEEKIEARKELFKSTHKNGFYVQNKEKLTQMGDYFLNEVKAPDQGCITAKN